MSLGLDYATIIDTTGTASGNVSYTNTNFGGGTPKVVITFGGWDNGPNNGSSVNNANHWIGAADDNGNEWAMTASDEHGQTTTDSAKESSTSNCMLMYGHGTHGPTTWLAGAYNAMVTNGFQVNYGSAPSFDLGFFAMAFGGDALTGYEVGTFTPDQTVGNSVSPTTTGFTADLILLFTVDDSAASPGTDDYGIGVGACDASLNQCSYMLASLQGQSTSNTVAHMSNTRALLIPDTGGKETTLEITAINSGSFTVYTRDVNVDISDCRVGYVALAFQNAQTLVQTFQPPTSTGSAAQTSIGFQSEVILEFASILDTLNSDDTTNASSISFQVMDANGDEAALSMAMEDGQTTTDTQTQMEHQAIFVETDAGPAEYAGTLTSIDATGMTRNWTTVDATAKYFIQIAIEEDAGSAVPTDERKVPRLVSSPILRGVL